MNTTNLKTRLENKVQALQTTGIALATADSSYAALTANTLEIYGHIADQMKTGQYPSNGVFHQVNSLLL